MGQLVDGKWSSQNVLFQHDEKGLYFKCESVFRQRINDEPEAEFLAEAGRSIALDNVKQTEDLTGFRAVALETPIGCQRDHK